MEQPLIINKEIIQNKIYTIRGLQIMLDKDLAELYQVETKNLNKAVKRNIERFPPNFMFQLTQNEYDHLRFHFGTSSLDDDLSSTFQSIENVDIKEHGGRRYLPYAFTEQGVAMLCTILRSKIAIDVSIQIIDTFVQMKKLISNNSQYSKIELKKFTSSHDRFLILDDNRVYHIGASLKDLGKKWFAFSKLDIDANEILVKLETI